MPHLCHVFCLMEWCIKSSPFWRFADVFRFQRMPVTCAPFCLTRFAGIVLTPRNLRLMKVRAMMESERLLSSSPSISTPNKNKKLKQSVDVSMEKGLVKSEAFEIQMIRDDPSRLEAMTLQQLRTTSRNLGIPAKGSKHDLLLTVKCFLENEKDEVRCDPERTESRRKARNLSGGDNSLNTSLATEISGSQQKKRRGKLPSNDNTIADINEGTVTMTEELRNTTDGITETVVLQHKKSGVESLSVDGTNVKVRTRAVTSTKKQGPYVKTDEVPDTKRSRAQKKGLSGDDNGNDGSSGGLGLSTDLSEPWTMLAHKKPQPGWIPYNPRTMRPPPLADGTEFVKLLSWNVNGLRALLKLEGFSALQLAQRENFDVLCLQETKLQEKDVEEIKRCLIDGYDNSFWTCSVSKLGYSGTAIISRIKPLSVRYGLGILDHDSEGRLVTVEFDTFYLICGYIPNSGDGLKRLTYRIAEWDMSLSNYMKELEKSKPVILTGDLNCAHQEIDIYNPAGNRRSAGFTIEERQSFETNFLSRGFVDTFRRQHPGVLGYTYWGYRHGGRVGNKGWRLDYFLVSESIADKVHDSYILPDVLGSDHCPIGLILKL